MTDRRRQGLCQARTPWRPLGRRCALGAAVAAMAWLSSPVASGQSPPAPADDLTRPASEPAMLRYPPSSARGWVLGAGVGVTAVAYGAGMACGFGWDDVPGADALKVPVVGPWVALGQSGCAPDQDDCTAELVLRTILTTLDGLAQLGGVGLILEGLLMTTEADAPPTEKGAAASASTTPDVELLVTPAVGPTMMGGALHLSF